jgi:hypothetical protein
MAESDFERLYKRELIDGATTTTRKCAAPHRLKIYDPDYKPRRL